MVTIPKVSLMDGTMSRCDSANVLAKSSYDTIICIYVLNVLRGSEQKTVLNALKKLLKSGGVCYLAVRRDIPKSGTKTQYWVELNLPSVHKTQWYEIYKMEKNA
jgi:chemotaxis methyl-accepting protein methylase